MLNDSVLASLCILYVKQAVFSIFAIDLGVGLNDRLFIIGKQLCPLLSLKSSVLRKTCIKFTKSFALVKNMQLSSDVCIARIN